jgi:RNA polymerase sigma factor (sigma-70 family)
MAHGALQTLLKHVRHAAGDAGPLSDAQLLDRYLARRDEAAFAALVRRHGGLVLAACRRALTDEADIEDAFQATFLVLLRKAATIRHRQALGGWLYRVAARAAGQARSAAESRRRREWRAASVAGVSDPGYSAAPDPSWREVCALLHAELDRLPVKLRLPLILCYLDGKARDEAARQLGWSLDTLRGRLERGRKLLRTRLNRRGVSLSTGLLAAVASDAAADGGALPHLVRLALAAASRPSQTVAALAAAATTLAVPGPAKLAIGVLLTAGLCVGLWTATPRPLSGAAPADEARTPAPKNSAAAPADPDDRRAVRGRVLTPDGKPAVNATIYRLDFGSRGLKAAETKVATTGPDGRFEAPATDQCLFAAAAAGFAPDWFTPGDGDGDPTLTLAPETPIRGRLIGLEGKPVRGAKVRVLAVTAPADGNLRGAYDAFRLNPEWTGEALPKRIGGGSAGTPAEATTDADGRFELTGLGRNRVVELRFEADGIEAAKVFVITAPDFDLNAVTPTAAEKTMSRFLPDYRPAVYGPAFTHAAHPCHVITGAVTDAATGAPVAGVKVVGTAGPTYRSDEPDWSNSVQAVTDAAGRFRLSGLPKARRRFLHAEAGDNPYLDQLIDVRDAEGLAPVPVAVKLHRCVVVEGRLTDAATGRPVKGEAHYAPMTDNEQLTTLPEARLYRGGLFTVHPSGTWSATDADGKFRLRVLHGPGVILARADTGRDPAARYTPARAAEADRQFLRRPTPGAIEVGPKFRADDESFNTADVTHPLRWENGYALINPGAGDDTVTCAIRFDPGRVVTGTVVRPDGGPVTGAMAVGVQATG